MRSSSPAPSRPLPETGDPLDFIRRCAEQAVDPARRAYLQTALSVIGDPPPGISPDGDAVMEGYAETITDALRRMGLPLPGRVFFSTAVAAEINAHAFCDGTDYRCVLNRGMIRLLHHLSMAAYLQLYCLDESDSLLPENSPPAIDASFVAARIYARQYLEHSSHDLFYPRGFRLSNDGLAEANILGASMKLFLTAHEIAHVVLGHADAGAGTDDLSQEFAADALAQDILITIDQFRLFSFPVSCGGLGMLMSMWFVLHEVRLSQTPEFNPADSTDSHPSVPSRVRALDAQLQCRLTETGLERAILTPCIPLQRLLARAEQEWTISKVSGVGEE